MKKTIMKKLLALLSASFMLATCAACSCDSEYLNGSDSPSASDTTSDTTPDQSDTASPIALQTPMHLSFDEENSILTWDAVDNAVCYLIDHNGEIIENSETQVYVLTQEGENTFKVKAVGDGVNYTDSDWSEEYCYVMPAQVSVYEKVTAKIAETVTGYKLTLEKVLGIEEVNLTSGRITFQTICTSKGVSVYRLVVFKHENPLSVHEILNTFELATPIGTQDKNIVDYNSVEILLNSGLYVGAMEDFKNSGYEISAIQTAVQEGEKGGSRFTFYIVGTFKAYTEYDVQYFTVKYKVYIPQASSDMYYNYVVFLAAADLREITEVSCLIHTEYETLEYMQDWAKENDPNYKSAK